MKFKLEVSEKTFSNILSHISTIDARDDSSEVGYYSTGLIGKNWPKVYCVSPSLKDGIHEWLVNYLAINENAEGAPGLLMVIKKL